MCRPSVACVPDRRQSWPPPGPDDVWPPACRRIRVPAQSRRSASNCGRGHVIHLGINENWHICICWIVWRSVSQLSNEIDRFWFITISATIEPCERAILIGLHARPVSPICVYLWPIIAFVLRWMLPNKMYGQYLRARVAREHAAKRNFVVEFW